VAFGLTQRFGKTAASVGAVELIAAAAGVPTYISAPLAMAEVARATLGFVSPYSLGNYRQFDADATDNYSRNGNLPMTSMARLGTRRGDGAGGNRDFGAQAYLSQFVSPEQEVREAGMVVQGTAGAALQGQSTFRRYVAPGQEQRQVGAEYDYGRLRAEIDTLATQYRDFSGLDKPADPNAGLPIQTIRDNEGRVLMQGAAESPEALIAQKLGEAERSSDPAKKVVNLAGANLEGLNFKGFNFTNVDMRGANMSKCEIDNCKFENVDAEGINLKGTKIRNTHMENMNLNGFLGDKDTKLSGVTMVGVHMNNAEAPGITMENIRGEQISAAGANFKGAKISDFRVHNLWAPEIDLSGAQIGGFHISGPESNLDEAKFVKATVNDASFGEPGQGIPMRGLQAQGSTWSNSQFNNSQLDGSHFDGAVFKTNVDMRNVTTRQGPISMNGADVSGLTAGPECKIKASWLICGQGADRVTMSTQNGQEMLFDGTADIQKFHRIARSNNLSDVRITEDLSVIDPITGRHLSEQINAPGLVQQAQRPKPRPALLNDPFAGGPSFKKKDQPWG
jgi:uncharacterized protein YjbI with pentapeptide repeats